MRSFPEVRGVVLECPLAREVALDPFGPDNEEADADADDVPKVWVDATSESRPRQDPM